MFSKCYAMQYNNLYFIVTELYYFIIQWLAFST